MKRPMKRGDGKCVWVAEIAGYEGTHHRYTFSNEQAARLWLRWEHNRQKENAVIMNAHERENRQTQIAEIEAGEWERDGREEMLAYFRDPETAIRWVVTEIEWGGYISRFTYMSDDYRIRREKVLDAWSKPPTPEEEK